VFIPHILVELDHLMPGGDPLQSSGESDMVSHWTKFFVHLIVEVYESDVMQPPFSHLRFFDLGKSVK
jgi:hypothetical protein